MNVNRYTVVGTAATSALFLDGVVTRNIHRACVIIPSIGYALKIIGNHCHINGMREVGSEMLFTAVLLLPGSIVSYVVHDVLYNAIESNSISIFVAAAAGAAVHYKVNGAI